MTVVTHRDPHHWTYAMNRPAMRPARPLARVLTLAVAFLAARGSIGARPSEAASITYTETVTASGSLGGTAFTNALVTLVALADPLAVVSTADGAIVTPSSIALTIAGIPGTATFTGAVQVGLNRTNGGTYFHAGSLDVLDIFGPAFASSNYDLRSSFGPVTGMAAGNPGVSFATTAGTFKLDTVPVVQTASVAGTFGAVAVGLPMLAPEPASWVLLGLGLAGVGAARLRAIRTRDRIILPTSAK